jgi:hypothetical protein
MLLDHRWLSEAAQEEGGKGTGRKGERVLWLFW